MSAHGYGPYTRGCRCAVCRAAKATYMRERRGAGRVAAKGTDQIPPSEHANPHRYNGRRRHLALGVTHGTVAAYDEHGCRCRPCTAAASAKSAAEKRRRAARRRQLVA